MWCLTPTPRFSVVFVINTTLVIYLLKFQNFFAKFWEYTRFISKVRSNLWHQDDLILNPSQLLKLWVRVKVRVRVPFAWSCREDMLCWWPWPPSPFLVANSTQNYFLIAGMLIFLWHSRQSVVFNILRKNMTIFDKGNG